MFLSKKRKGFTLAEILGVIVIIGLLLILVVPTVLNRINSSKGEAEETGIQIIYDATDQYIREHPKDYPPGKSGRYCIPIQSLIDDGKLAAPVVDVTTGEDISHRSVMVTIYTAGTSDYEIREGDDCEAISALPMIDFDVTPKGSSWVKERTLKIIWPEIDGDYRARYRIDNGDWIYVDSINNKEGGTLELLFNKSSSLTPIEAQYVGKGGETSTDNIITSKINIVNIDSVAPTCTMRLSGTKGNNNWYKSNVTVDFGEDNQNLDDDLSGVLDYGISTSNIDTFGKVSSLTQKDDIANITYYGYVKDKAGNIGKCDVTFKKDATKPTLTYTLRKINNGVDEGPAYSNQWSQRQIKRNFDPKDNLSEIARVEYSYNGSSGWTTEGNVGDWLMNEGKLDAYWRSIDNAGNISSPVHIILLVDWTPPTINFGMSGYFTATVSCSDNNSGVNGSKNWTVGLSGTWNNTVNASCKDYAGNVQNTSHVYRYNSCRYTVNTCQGGYDSVWSNCAYYKNVCQGCTKPSCAYLEGGPANCTMNCGAHCYWNGRLCCENVYNSCCTTKKICQSGYVKKWNSCKYGSPNECRGGFDL